MTSIGLLADLVRPDEFVLLFAADLDLASLWRSHLDDAAGWSIVIPHPSKGKSSIAGLEKTNRVWEQQMRLAIKLRNCNNVPSMLELPKSRFDPQQQDYRWFGDGFGLHREAFYRGKGNPGLAYGKRQSQPSSRWASKVMGGQSP